MPQNAQHKPLGRARWQALELLRTVLLVAQALYEAAGQRKDAAEGRKALQTLPRFARLMLLEADPSKPADSHTFAEVSASVRAARHRPGPLCLTALPPACAASWFSR